MSTWFNQFVLVLCPAIAKAAEITQDKAYVVKHWAYNRKG